LIAIFPAGSVFSQLYRVSGVVRMENREPLPLASIEVKELKSGKITKDDGSFEFFLERGKYSLVVSMVGFKPKVVPVIITNEDIFQDIIMENDSISAMSEVVIRIKPKDRAEEYIRNVIRNKDDIQASVGSYSCNIYIKATEIDSADNNKQKKIVDTSAIDFEAMSMAEIYLRFNKHEDGRVKEEKEGVRKEGNMEGLFYLSGTEGDFNIYNNLIKAPSLSDIPFISPVSYSGLLAYRFKTLKIDRSQKPRRIIISVKPRQLSNATIEGELTIIDSLFVIEKAEFRLPPAHIPEYDFFEVKQQYVKKDSNAWVISRQQFNYNNRTKTGKKYGQTTAVYSDYTLHKNFPRGFFGNEISTTTIQAYNKDSVFWKSVRSEPLSVQERLYTIYRDSLFDVMHSDAYLDSMDRVLNKVTWHKLLIFGQMIHDHRKERTWVVPPITTLYQPFQFGGGRLQLMAIYKKIFPSRKTFDVEVKTSYGFRNEDINGRIKMQRLYNPFTRGYLSLTGGRDFQNVFEDDAWINRLRRNNIYLNNFVEIGHVVELVNGVVLSNHFEVAFRRSVSGYKTNAKVDSLFNNILGVNQPQDFQPYNAVYNSIKLELTPKQKYLREPKEKIIIGSKYPTFYVFWKKGVSGIFKSQINFDYLEYGFTQRILLGVAGVSSYTLKTGSFLNTNDLRYIDYQFQRRGDPIFFQDPNRLFQSLDSTFPLFQRFYQGNYVHEFNGLFINKIPFMKQFKLQEVAGGGFLIAPERSLKYFEAFAGIERVFKWPPNPLSKFKVGFFVVGSFANQFKNPIQFKVSFVTWDRFANKWK
jgi:hypothetical protein